MSPWRAAFQEAWEKGVVLVNFACAYHVFTNYIMEVTMCMGPSMLPTFNAAGDVVLLEHLSPRFDSLKAGDVVVAKSPTNPKLTVCKRVVGTEGAHITVLPIDEREHVRHVTVPKGHVWLQGDNRYNSTDSRHYGPVPYALLRGKVFYKIWPPQEIGPVLSQRP